MLSKMHFSKRYKTAAYEKHEQELENLSATPPALVTVQSSS
jgi:hypothetical protein